MQSRNGGYGAFDTENDADFLNRIPFADMEAMIDPPTEDLTGRLLAPDGDGRLRHGLRAGDARASSSSAARSAPTAAGGGAGASTSSTAPGARWPGSRAIGEDMRAPYVRRAVDWLDRAAERRRRLGRDDRVVRRRTPRGHGRVHRRRRRRGRCSASSPRATVRQSRGRARRRYLAARAADRRWHVGRAAVHGHGIPAPLLPPVPPLPALSSR